MRVDGEDLGDYLPEERAGLGMVRSFQDCRLFPELSVEDTLMLSEDAGRPVGVSWHDAAGARRPAAASATSARP